MAPDAREVRMLRAELAKRDRELLAAAAARRRTADQSERAAAALRAKLAELEAAVAATPSTSSRASSPRSSERGSPMLGAMACVERGVQTEPELWQAPPAGWPSTEMQRRPSVVHLREAAGSQDAEGWEA